MKLTRIRIRNFRSIDDLEIRPQDYTSLIGPNNSGKSSVLRAIKLFLNQEKPTPDDWRYGHKAEQIELEADFDTEARVQRPRPPIRSQDDRAYSPSER